jgi:hypothetical protein
MEIKISIRGVELSGLIESSGIINAYVVFACGSKFDIFPDEIKLVEELKAFGVASVLCNLLTEKEELSVKNTERVTLITERFIALSRWCLEDARLKGLKQGYFGVGTGTAVALSASAYWGTKVAAMVSYNGRPDIAMEELDLVESPVLLIVSSDDEKLVTINRQSYQKIGCVKKMENISDPNKVCVAIVNWFERFLKKTTL